MIKFWKWALNPCYISVVDPLKEIWTKYNKIIYQFRPLTNLCYLNIQVENLTQRYTMGVNWSTHVTIHNSHLKLSQITGDILLFHEIMKFLGKYKKFHYQIS